MMIKNVTFGSDPEYFVKNHAENLIISGIPFIHGTKEKPESLNDGFFILKDNILAEGNIPPSSDPIKFMTNLIELKTRINKYLGNVNHSLGVFHSDCEDVHPNFLVHPESLLFGCSPYLNAWDNEIHKANDLSKENFRTAGFHIHIGYEQQEDNPFNKEIFNKIITRAFDLFVIIPSMNIYVDQRRFENYGGLGQYRDTAYGLECRSLGAFFVDEKYLPWVIEQTCRALSFIKSFDNAKKLFSMKKPEIIFTNKRPSFNEEIYTDLNIDFFEQIFTNKYKIYATSI
jgi:hypothetical protein